MRRRKRGHRDEDNGFAQWGGYMEAKKTKLQDQFKIDAAREPNTDGSQIFNGVAIFVNGYSVPSADELKLLMMKHGGIYHHYYRTDKTTHIIATNLPDTKVKQLKTMNVVKPDWVVDSIAAGKLLDYRQYLLYSRQSKTQPKLSFRPVSDIGNKPSTSTATVNISESNELNCDMFHTEDNSSTTIIAAPMNEDDRHNSDSFSNNEDACLKSNCSEESKNSNGCNFLYKDLKIAQSKITSENNVQSISKSTSHSIKTSSEAGFLSEFYSNSRLHHISTMGAGFKQYVNSLREKSTDIFPGAEKLKMWKENESSSNPYILNVFQKYKSVIMHIDMDCFFVSVGLRKRPELNGLPVAVTHAKAGGESTGSHRVGVNRKTEFDLYKTRREDKYKTKNLSNLQTGDVRPWSDWVESIDESNSMSEIASCNYEARKHGLKNGMFLGQALKLCPKLKTIPYDFEGYKEVSYCLYDTVASYTLDIEALSCDEMFVDCTALLNSTGTTPLQLASLLRAEIKEKTGCPCSTGFGSNRLQARLATKKAKPDGQFYLDPSEVQAFMEDIKVSDLPGVGRSTNYKLANMGVKTCLDLQQIPLAKLQSEFGLKSGESLYKHSRGEDAKKLVFGQVRKSVSAEVNYGIRFQNLEEAETFLQELAREVHNRLQEVNMKTKFVTLKLMIKAKDAPAESAKFLGHGVCDHISRSSSFHTSVSDIDSITREVLSLSRQLNIEPTELRGIGIQLSRLESMKTSKPPGNVIDKFLRPKTEIARSVGKDEQKIPVETTQKKENKSGSSKAIDNFFVVKKHIPDQSKQMSSNVKPINPTEIDKDFLEALPEDIRREVIQEYGLSQQEGRHDPSTEQLPKESGKPASYNNRVNYSQIDLEVFEELPPEIKKEFQSSISDAKRKNIALKRNEDNSVNNIDHTEQSNKEPKLDRNLPLGEIRALIKAWTASEECPQPCDTNMLADYLEGLVVSRQLESLDICISCLHRCIEKRQCVLWQEAYHAIISGIQSVMVAVYGLHLRVRHTFKHLNT